MPLDPRIITSAIQPAADLPDPFTQFLKLQGARNAIGQGQIQQQQIESGGLAIEQHKMEMAKTAAINKAYMDALTVDPEGKPSIDTGGLTKALASGGHGAAIPGILEGVAKSQKTLAELQELRGKIKTQEADAAGAVGAAVDAAGNDPHLFLTLATHAAQTGIIDPKTLAPLLQQIQRSLQDDPSGETAKQGLSKITGQLIAGSPTYSQRKAAQMTAQAKADAEARQKREEGGIISSREATTAHTQAETDKLNREAEMIRNTKPEDVLAVIDKVADPKANPALNVRAKEEAGFYLSKGDIKGAQDVIKRASEEIASTERSVATVRAEAPLKTAEALARAANSRADRSYQFSAAELDRLQKPIADQVARYGRLEESLKQGTASADALIAPELLTVVAGGQGSGVRLTDSELNRIVGGRSKLEDFKAVLQKWTTGRSITPVQQKQIESLVGAVGNKMRAKQDVMTEARKALSASDKVQEHRQIISDVTEKTGQIDRYGHYVGETVKVHGKPVKILKINPDGSFEDDQ